MWYLTSENDKRVIYVFNNKKVIIGRSIDAQNCNFAVPDDPSLSRKHAVLSLSGNDLVLQDLGSKYGSYINNSSERVEPEVLQKLKFGDIVKFGKMHCIWKICKVNLITCASTLKGENLQSLKTNLAKLGAKFKTEWDDECSFLTMPALTLTIKVVLALVHGAHIVTTEYWTKFIDATNNNAVLPNPNDYIPQIVESTLNKEIVSFVPDEQRKFLFRGKKFIFFSKRQLEMYKNVLKKSSATPLLLSESKMTKSGLCESDIIVIQYNMTSTSQESQVQKDQINEIVNYLKSNKKRIIPDSEIGLAILYCSTSKYCNPSFNFTSEVIKQVDPITRSNRVLAQESQEPTQRLNENVIINESLDSRNANNNEMGLDRDKKGKRKLEDDGINAVYKKMVTESLINVNEEKKRAADEELSHACKKVALDHNDDGDNMFNFISSTSTSQHGNSGDTNKKLNLSKPSKRKFINEDNDEEDLFNFVDSKKPCSSLINVISNDTKQKQDQSTLKIKCDDVNMENLRGSKLQELMANVQNIKTRNIKQEDVSDLDEKFSNIDLGSTTIIVRNDLIIKKEPIEIKNTAGTVKNFKKFKKVWPIKMQVSIIS